MSLLNLTLEQARAESGGLELEIVETAPPRTPQHYTPLWGAWRVIRERPLEGGTLQIVVARELLKELPRETPSQTG